MKKKKMTEHWEQEYEKCKSDPGYFFQEYFVVKKLHELKDVKSGIQPAIITKIKKA